MTIRHQPWKRGDRVRFAHQSQTGPSYRVTAAGIDGMIEIDGLPGQFAAHVFVVPETVASKHDKEAQSGGFDGYGEELKA